MRGTLCAVLAIALLLAQAGSARRPLPPASYSVLYTLPCEARIPIYADRLGRVRVKLAQVGFPPNAASRISIRTVEAILDHSRERPFHASSIPLADFSESAAPLPGASEASLSGQNATAQAWNDTLFFYANAAEIVARFSVDPSLSDDSEPGPAIVVSLAPTSSIFDHYARIEICLSQRAMYLTRLGCAAKPVRCPPFKHRAPIQFLPVATHGYVQPSIGNGSVVYLQDRFALTTPFEDTVKYSLNYTWLVILSMAGMVLYMIQLPSEHARTPGVVISETLLLMAMASVFGGLRHEIDIVERVAHFGMHGERDVASHLFAWWLPGTAQVMHAVLFLLTPLSTGEGSVDRDYRMPRRGSLTSMVLLGMLPVAVTNTSMAYTFLPLLLWFTVFVWWSVYFHSTLFYLAGVRAPVFHRTVVLVPALVQFGWVCAILPVAGRDVLASMLAASGALSPQVATLFGDVLPAIAILIALPTVCSRWARYAKGLPAPQK